MPFTHVPLTALMEYYGERFTRLPAEQQEALCADIAGIIREEGLTHRMAVQTLDRRIWNELESYARTLTAY